MMVEYVTMTEYARCFTPLGEMLLASEGDALCGAWFVGQKYFPLLSGEERENDLLRRAARELEGYFAGELRRFSIPLRPHGTNFQKKVWSALSDIDYGHTETYGKLAALLHSSPRAVGSATGRNPISLFIPCHRLIGADGSLTGYAGGLEKKKALLTLEGIEVKDGLGRMYQLGHISEEG
jgi:methylated-DNA-[protein]-cysteine S-methyltransferase